MSRTRLDADKDSAKQTTVKKPKRGRRKRLAVVCACAAAVLAVVLGVASTASAVGQTVGVSVGSQNHYDSYSTAWMTADGEVAYCAEPQKATPSSGSYVTGSLWSYGSDVDRSNEVKADLWFGWGGPGFDASMWPSTYYDGSPMDASAYHACTHILISDTFSSNASHAMYGCSEAFRSWVVYNITGFDLNGAGEINPNAVGRQMNARAGEVPDSFDAFTIGTGSATQTLVSFAYTPEGDLEIWKSSAEPDVTNGNSEYSLEGAVYGIYSDEGCTQEVARVTTNADGYAKAEKLAAGGYWIKELSASKGYDVKDGASYVEVKSGETAKVDGEAAAEPVQKGWIEVWKKSSEPDITENNDCYSLAGAVFDVKDAGGNVVDTITTNDDGWARTKDLPLGDYTVTETASPKGFALDGAAEHNGVHISGHAATHVEQTDEPKGDPVETLIYKVDKDTGQTVPQGDGELSGAEFTIKYYKGTYNLGNLPASAERTWVVKTGTDGKFNLQDDYAKLKVSGDDWYMHNDTNRPYFPLGTVTVTETKAPEGYLVNAETECIVIDDDHVGQGGWSVNRWQVKMDDTDEQVRRGGLMVVKADSQTGQPAAQGGATLAAATFSVTNKSDKAVEVHLDGKKDDSQNKVTVEADQLIEGLVLTTDENGVATTDKDGDGVDYTLPYGTYELAETSAPQGYLKTDEKITVTVHPEETGEKGDGYVFGSKVSWTADGGWNTTTGNYDDGLTFYDRVKRGDLSFSKKNGMNGTKMSSVPFLIVSKSTGEAHVVVTDENGTFSSSASWNAHTKDTNASDAAVTGRAAGQSLTDYYKNYPDVAKWSIDASKLNDEAGVWFSMNAFGTTCAADDTYGAFPYDTERFQDGGYRLLELPCEANKDMTLVDTTFNVSRDGYETDYGTVDDNYITIATTASYGEDSEAHDGKAVENCVIVDRISYDGFTPKETYKLVGSLMDTETGETVKDAEGNDLSSEKEFTPESPSGKVRVDFTFDASSYAGRSVTVFERAYDKTGNLVAAHADIDSEDQTVSFPKIGTKATDGVTGDNEIGSTASDTVKLVDTVAFENLTVGKTYKVTGTLMDKATGEAILGKDGKAVTAEKEFTPETATGTVDVTFEFDASYAEGKTVVAFETLSRQGRELAVHADIDDYPQSVLYPKIATTAKDITTGGQVGLASGVCGLVDTVAFENLPADKTYKLVGTLMDKATGKALTGADGKTVTASAEFTPAKVEGAKVETITFGNEADGADTTEVSVASGTVDVTFEFDAEDVAGKTTVVFERLSTNGVDVAAHEDIDDEGQTVAYPKIGTTAVDGTTGTHEGLASGTVKLVDTVAYENLTVGKTYKVTGTLMDKKTGEALKDADGKTVTASAEFTPEKADGTVDVTFEFDASLVEGKTIVAFEDVYENDVLVGVHADIDDEGQTVTYPKIGTTATDAADGDHEISTDASVKVIDTVAYENLTVGKTYKVTGTLMDKKTGEALKDADGKTVTASAEFTPEEADGTVDVTFEFDASKLEDGIELVAFEQVADAEGNLVAAHEDIDDEGQTVKVSAPVTNPVQAVAKAVAKTGDKMGPVLLAALLVLAGALIAAGCAMRHRRKAKAEQKAEIAEAVAVAANALKAEASAGAGAVSDEADEKARIEIELAEFYAESQKNDDAAEATKAAAELQDDNNDILDSSEAAWLAEKAEENGLKVAEDEKAELDYLREKKAKEKTS